MSLFTILWMEGKMKITRRNFFLVSGLGTASIFARPDSFVRLAAADRAKSAFSRFEAWIELNLENMAWNLERLRKHVKVPIMAVVKANGYGHGLVGVSRFLERKGIDSLMVGKLDEAFLLRDSGIIRPILNFGPFGSQDAEEIIQRNISQSVFTDRVKILQQAAIKLQKKAKVHIHIDTGMGRAGIPYHKALPYVEEVSSLNGIKIEGISTTLTEDQDFDQEQMKRFLTLCQQAESKGISLGRKHAASSSGIMTLPESYLDMVRPGIALYGYYPSEKTRKEDLLSLKPVLQLKSCVYSIKYLRPGDSVSYHRAYIARKKEKIALIPLGYSDGYPFRALGKACVLIRGEKFPLIGAITANHMVALLEKNSPVVPGDEVVLVGSQGQKTITADEVGHWAGESAYKVLLGLNPLLPRIVLNS